jgi:hypothetical protein
MWRFLPLIFLPASYSGDAVLGQVAAEILAEALASASAGGAANRHREW